MMIILLEKRHTFSLLSFQKYLMINYCCNHRNIWYNFCVGDNMNYTLIKEDLEKIPSFLCGIFILSIGIYLTKIAYVGLSPWSVLHDGISETLGISFGTVTMVLGVIILLLSMIFLKTKVGIGTILNVAIIGNLINLYEMVYSGHPDNIFIAYIVFGVGLLLTTFGRSLYIASNLGQGPRDGLFVGLARVTSIDVKYIKPVIEFTALLLGILLNGNFGVGTIILVLFSGYIVQFFFKLLGFDPKTKKQSDFIQYFKKEISIT